MDFIFEQTFWTAITAIVAFTSLFITLIPYLYSWISRKKPNVSIPSNCTVGHFFGIPDFYMFIDIENNSQKDLRIESISIDITNPNREIHTINALSYFGTNLQDQNLKVFVPLTIKKRTKWSNNIRFFTPALGEDDNTLKIISKMFKEAINKAREEGEMNNALINCFKYDINLEDKANNYYEKNKYWIEGQYEVILNIKTGNTKTDIKKIFSFNLLHIDILTLEDLFKHDIKFGTGILMNSLNHYIYPFLKVNN